MNDFANRKQSTVALDRSNVGGDGMLTLTEAIQNNVVMCVSPVKVLLCVGIGRGRKTVECDVDGDKKRKMETREMRNWHRKNCVRSMNMEIDGDVLFILVLPACTTLHPREILATPDLYSSKK